MILKACEYVKFLGMLILQKEKKAIPYQKSSCWSVLSLKELKKIKPTVSQVPDAYVQ